MTALVACGGGKSNVASSTSSNSSAATTTTTTTTVVATEPPITAAAAEPPPTEPPPTEPAPTEPLPTEPPTTQPPPTQPPPPGGGTITATNYMFSPTPLNMAPGSVNLVSGGGSHTFVSDTGAWQTCIGCTVTLGTGSYPYHCGIHGAAVMSGVINVS